MPVNLNLLPMNSQVKIAAPAKLTLSLKVQGRMENGYHQIIAEMVSLDLADTLEISPVQDENDLRVELQEEFNADIPLGQENLVIKALELAGKKAKVRIQKNIPPGSGLGGGSSNAAAILRWAGIDDLKLAAGIGADVAFCLAGGRAKVSGFGEIVEPLEYKAETYTLLIPPFGCSTAEVYAKWDELGEPQGAHGNDLEPAALAVSPELETWKNRLAEISGRQPRLAGSGSTWFVEGDFGDSSVEGLIVARTLKAA